MHDEAAYPPGPWQLRGDLLVSVLRVPPHRVAGLDAALPAGHRPLTVRGHGFVGIAMVRYAPTGMLTYDELLVAVLTAEGRVPRVTIPQIWVTSPVSRAGGRALWGIPKDLASFGWEGRSRVRVEARDDEGAGIARLTARVGPRLVPGRVTLPLPTAQRRLDGSTVRAHNTVTGTLRRLAVRWDLSPEGPLGHLHGLRPIASAAVVDASIVFGRRVEES